MRLARCLHPKIKNKTQIIPLSYGMIKRRPILLCYVYISFRKDVNGDNKM
jgi:hypothetical protein